MVQWTLIPALESDWLLGTPIEANPLVKKFNRSSLKLEFVTSSVLWFGSLEKPERAEGPNLDFVHVDEARLVRNFDLAWQVLTRRLRGSNSAMPYPRGAWITTTPDTPSSPLYNFFEHPSTKDPEAKVYRWSIYDNPTLPPQFLRQIERSHHDSLAERFIYGRFAVAGVGSFGFDATIHVREIDPRLLKEIRYGVDFGWTNPTAIVALGYDGDGRVWVLDEVYQRQMRQEDIIQVLIEFREKYGEGDILCDPSNPETIDALRRAELNASGYHAKREDGLREFGGRFAKAGDGQPRIFVSKLCVNLTSELLEYREDVKENDHACFVAGTMVTTQRGQVPIELIEESDLVWTRRGLRPIEASGFTGIRDVMGVLFDNGSSIIGTSDHPIFVADKGFIRMDTLRYAYKCQALTPLPCESISVKKEKSKNSEEQYTIAIPTVRGLMSTNTSEQAAGTELLTTFTGTFGNSIRALFLKDTAFIIKMVTPLITRLRILSASLKRYISQTTTKNGSQILREERNRGNIWTEFDLSQKLGTLRRKAENGTASNGRDLSVNPSNIQRKYVRSAAANSLISQRSKTENSVLVNVKPVHCVSVEKYSGKQRVYNLKVEGASEFFANGILVHNCDALRYALKLGPSDEVTRARFLPFRR